MGLRSTDHLEVIREKKWDWVMTGAEHICPRKGKEPRVAGTH